MQDQEKSAPLPGRDYYFNAQGLLVFTATYLRARGHCCGNGCLHCPYPVDGIPARKGSRNYQP